MAGNDASKHPHGTAGRRLDCDSLLIEALLVGSSTASAAQHAGVGRKTVLRRMRNKQFMARLSEERARVIRRVVDLATWHALSAANKIAEHMESKDPDVSLRACALLLNHTARLREFEQYESRLLVLENVAAAASAPPPRSRRAG
jgi:hypothetical protein